MQALRTRRSSWNHCIYEIMRVGLQTWGTEGDIRPFAALVQGLAEKGHHTLLSMTGIQRAGDDLHLSGDRIEVTSPGRLDIPQDEFSRLGRKMVSSGNPAMKSRVFVRTLLNPSMHQMFEAAMDICGNCDAALGHPFAYSLRAAAALRGIPWFSLLPTPLIPSTTVPPPGFPGVFPEKGWKAFGLAMDMLWRPDIAGHFRQWGLPAPESVFRDIFRSDLLNLVAVSPALYPGGGVPGFEFCGMMDLPGQGNGDMPVSLQDFLASGEPPVFFTFGSMLQGEEREKDIIDIVVKAVAIAGCRAVVQCGAGKSGGSIHFVSKVDHMGVFPHCAAVVHHGGAGTSQTACRAGVPSVVVEYTADQPLWGHILHRAGVAPGMLHRRSLTPGKLARKIDVVLTDKDYSTGARRMASRMKEENGVETAVRLMEMTLGGMS